eukprot:scaffold3281_cov129-Cylindrotheca_fusiformis.AAC.6
MPCSLAQWKKRQEIDNILAECWGANDGYEVQLSDEWIVNGERFLGSQDMYRPSTYGEITPLGARQLFDEMEMQERKHDDIVFMDLGSGAGKLVLQAYLELECLAYAVGIELSPTRHQTALRSLDRVRKMQPQKRKGSVEFVEGDIFHSDISKATHIYVSSLCFTPVMIQDLESKVKHEATCLECIASLTKLERLGKASVCYIEMSWTKPNGLPVYFYRFDKSSGR